MSYFYLNWNKSVLMHCIIMKLLSVYHMLCFMILLFIMWMMAVSLKSGCFKHELMHQLEYFFLFVPLMVISGMMWVSLPHLYMMSMGYMSNMMMIMGFQWYWVMNNIEMYINHNELSYMAMTDSIQSMVNCTNFGITGSSNDVIHSMYIPSLFFKMDLIPGRMTTTSLEVGVTNYGVCAEICGANHAFMPFKYNIM